MGCVFVAREIRDGWRRTTYQRDDGTKFDVSVPPRPVDGKREYDEAAEARMILQAMIPTMTTPSDETPNGT